MTLTVTDGPTVYAGADASICYDGTYTLSDASALNYSTITWTTSGDGTFDDNHAIHPVYTPGTNDKLALTATLTLTATSATCSPVNDDMVLTIAPELIASVGGVTPFLINSATTEINVTFWATHQNPAQLGFYLLAPDGVTQIRLYQHNIDGTPCSLLTKNTIDSLTFSTGSVADLNFCTIPGSVIKGTFDFKVPASTLTPKTAGFEFLKI